jgi:hypothetical protein
VKHTCAGPAKSINRKSPKGYLKKMERQREMCKLKTELEKEELKRKRAELEII